MPMMGAGCCQGGCWTDSDNFDRPDSTNIGAKWAECSGDWSIKSNRLRIDNVGYTLFLRRPPSSVNGIATIDPKDWSAGRKYRIRYGDGFEEPDYCREDPEEIRYDLEFEPDGAGGGTLRLFKVEPGKETEVGSEVIGTVPPDATMTLCAGPSRISGYIDGATYSLLTCGEPTGHWWGLAANASGEHLFDDWTLTEHYEQNHDCPQCWCGCEGECMQDELTYTFVNAQYCTHLDGLSGTIDGPDGCVWESNPVSPCLDDFNSGFEPFYLRLTNMDSGHEYTPAVGGWEIQILRELPGGGGPLAAGLSIEGSTCDPLLLRFGPFSFGGNPMDGLCCEGYWPTENIEDGQFGTFYVEVTE